MTAVVIGGVYLHYKQKKYLVIGTALHTETLEEVVVYEALYKNDMGQLWVRPKSMFLGEVDTIAYKGARFVLVPEDAKRVSLIDSE